MKKTNKFIALGVLTAFTTFPAFGAEAELKVQAEKPEVKVDAGISKEKESRLQYREEAKKDNEVKKSNKATGLLGMEIRNSKSEKLGEIKDLVVDLKTGKISYAVMAVGGFLGIGEKLLAIPPSALTAGEGETYLTLDADQAKVDAAPGFAATNWPDVRDPQVNAFWSKKEAVGGAAGVESRTDRDRERKLDIDVDNDRDVKIKTDADLDGVKKDQDVKGKIYTDADDKEVKVEIKKD